MQTIYFDTYMDFAESVGELFDTMSEDIISIIAPHDEAKQIIKELLFEGYNINDIDLHDGNTHIIELNKTGIWCWEYCREEVKDKITYISNNCSSTIVSRIKSATVVAYKIADDGDELLPESECYINCDGCDYYGTKFCDKDAPAVKSDIAKANDKFTVNGKPVSKAEFEKKEKEFLKEYCDMMDDFNNKLSTLDKIDQMIKSAFRI